MEGRENPDVPKGADLVYSAAEVLNGWRRFNNMPTVPPPAKEFVPWPKGLLDSNPGEPDPDCLDVPFLMACKVERFFGEFPHRLADKPLLMLGEAMFAHSEFVSWYGLHPLAIVDTSGNHGRSDAPENVPHPLREAVDRWNERHKQKHKRSYSVAARAAKAERLRVWYPDGKMHTTLAEIEKWIASDLRTAGRNSAP